MFFYHRLLEDIIKEYFCLLELGYSYGTNSINCVHYLALIDCVAVWFHKWMVMIITILSKISYELLVCIIVAC